jgi:hypothetical protein
MRVVIRITGSEKSLREDRRPNRGLAALAAAVFWPFGVVCFLVCGWRWAFDLDWTARFLIDEGVFSHWQPWFVAGTLWQVLAVTLRRYAEGGEAAASDAVAAAELLRKELP